jgi:hypothetical protein
VAIRLHLVMALVLGASAARADNGLLYLGAGIANDNLQDVRVATTHSNISSTRWQAWAGVRPIGVFAIEAEYLELGGRHFTTNPATGSNIRLDYHSFGVYAVGYLPIPIPAAEVFAKAGMAHWTLTGNNTVIGDLGGTFPLSDNASQFAWGAGGQLHFGDLGARLEYQSFSIRNTSGAKIVSLTVFLNLD